MITTLDLVPFLDLCEIDLTKASVLIAYAHQFIPSLILVNKIPHYKVGFYSLDLTKLKYAQMFRANVVYDLESALVTYNYIIIDGMIYSLEKLKNSN